MKAGLNFIMALMFLGGCYLEEPAQRPYSELVNRSVVVNYRVDSMLDNGDRCAWYVVEPVDRKLFDSIYMCGSYKIGDTLKLEINTHFSQDTGMAAGSATFHGCYH